MCSCVYYTARGVLWRLPSVLPSATSACVRMMLLLPMGARFGGMCQGVRGEAQYISGSAARAACVRTASTAVLLLWHVGWWCGPLVLAGVSALNRCERTELNPGTQDPIKRSMPRLAACGAMLSVLLPEAYGVLWGAGCCQPAGVGSGLRYARLWCLWLPPRLLHCRSCCRLNKLTCKHLNLICCACL